ncbi:Cysteine-rich secretory protein family protein [Gracilibacillus orientalis]|uniref:Cysteine-rich secretory protein family protein n=1 Tax=Gracilibacillus orientalis TaxID=334253 RepID=A0A1I4KXF3_9BACI|nr:Cysteine-rich secretory protein family protein [Gracilibacillus orientalis]
MMRDFGINYRSAAENIAQGQETSYQVVQVWMNSSGHRENILSENYTHIGVGYVRSGNYWTQMFMTK